MTIKRKVISASRKSFIVEITYVQFVIAVFVYLGTLVGFASYAKEYIKDIDYLKVQLEYINDELAASDLRTTYILGFLGIEQTTRISAPQTLRSHPVQQAIQVAGEDYYSRDIDTNVLNKVFRYKKNKVKPVDKVR